VGAAQGDVSASPEQPQLRPGRLAQLTGGELIAHVPAGVWVVAVARDDVAAARLQRRGFLTPVGGGACCACVRRPGSSRSSRFRRCRFFACGGTAEPVPQMSLLDDATSHQSRLWGSNTPIGAVTWGFLDRVWVPTIPSVQVKRHVRTREGCRRVGLVAGCRGGRVGPDR
jgi:hypothetical protein